MSKVTLIQVVWNSKKYIEKVFPAALNQTHPDTEFVAVIAGNEDGGKELIQEKFPQVKVIDPGYNIGFARGHNEYFAQSDSEFFQLVNPDLILEPNYVEEMLKAFEDPEVGAATGKLIKYDFDQMKSLEIIDTTGVIYSRSGRGRDRGQYEKDNGQYDSKTDLIAVSGAGPMYRKSALEAVKSQTPDRRDEYFDEDFHSYWEDVDLGLRMFNAGFKIKFVPKAVGYHGRVAASSPGGYKKVFAFIDHHKKISERVRKLNYKNHIFLFIKNTPKWYWQFFARELFYQTYVLFLETSTLKVLPEMFKQLPRIWQKRKALQKQKKISTKAFENMLI
ncbi:MAG: glycosyltransferase family 2 protein [Candidatus Doudnabacteria bacterium]